MESIKVVRSNQNCCVFGCKSVRKKNSNLMYHLFPRPEETINIVNDFGSPELCNRKKLWEYKLCMRKRSTKSAVVCSLHFKNDDYICSGWSSRKRLSPSAIPSLNLPNRSSDLTKTDNNFMDMNKPQYARWRSLYKSSKNLAASDSIVKQSVTCSELPTTYMPEAEAAETLLTLKENEIHKKQYKRVGVRTDLFESKCDIDV